VDPNGAVASMDRPYIVRDTAGVSHRTAPLADQVHTTSGWDVVDTAPTAERGVGVGSCFLAGNGYLGYRGTRPDQRAVDFVGCVVSDTYDMADGVWRELCTVPNGLFVEIELDGRMATFDTARPASAELRLETGEIVMRWCATTDAGSTASITMRRFASLDDIHLLMQQLVIEPEDSAVVTVAAGIDDEVWSLNGDHFASVDTVFDTAFDTAFDPAFDPVSDLPDAPDDGSPTATASIVTSRCITGERGTEIVVVTAVDVVGLAPIEHTATTIATSSRAVRGVTARRWTGSVAAGSPIVISSSMAVATSNDDDLGDRDALGAATASALRAAANGYEAGSAVSGAAWRRIWDTTDIRIDGDPAAQAALRFSIYHHRIATPAHSDRLPIGARGLSCQAYQGAAFWDQEMFNLPALLHTDPDLARALLIYRWRTLDGARRKADRLGYDGAFYAWISGDTGDELCPDFFFVDVLTGRPIRNHFNIWQIHISPDIAHAVWRYWDATGDIEFVVDHGAEIVFEVARFLRSRTLWSETRHRYELIRLLGPDEWHENVDHNAYTARLTRLAVRHALALHGLLAEQRPDALVTLLDRLELDDDDVDAWMRVERDLFEPSPDPSTLLIEPFDGFFALEDCRPEDLRRRLLDPGEYWGWPNGVAVHTQVSKQPDVVQMFAVDPSDPLHVQRANYDYFEPRCSHGSSLSHSVHATVATRLAGFDAGYVEQAYDYFMQTAALDLRTNAHSVVGGTFIGGMHTAANAGAHQTAIFGFGGFSTSGGVITIAPALPSAWTSLDYEVIVRGQRLAVTVTPSAVAVTASNDNTAPVRVRFDDDPSIRLVEPGDRLER
jgi:1,2-alpha-glucosylglycerol phosphorylase